MVRPSRFEGHYSLITAKYMLDPLDDRILHCLQVSHSIVYCLSYQTLWKRWKEWQEGEEEEAQYSCRNEFSSHVKNIPLMLLY